MKNERSKHGKKGFPSRYYLGIDGGGTKTCFKLVDEEGTVLANVCKGASNPNDVGMEKTLAVLEDGISEACKGIPCSQITMFAGIAGGGMSGDHAEVLHRFFEKFSFFAFENGSDIENLASLSDEEKRILVIMGTGFIVYAINGTEKKRISGWGQLFDDGGSGYTLGRDAVSAVLSEIDGSGRKTVLTSLFEKTLGESAEAHLTEFYKGGKRYIAGFAPLVFQAAEMNDVEAMAILDRNMRFVAEKIGTALAFLRKTPSRTEIPVLFGGSLCRQSEVLFPLIQKYIAFDGYQLVLPNSEPVDGAVRRAKEIYKNYKIEEDEIF
ncbi:MAG: hypothetical protein IKD07_02515 [Clostridia bacterium]|nr:hypothetical protein [Clostridia bacterium]